MTLTAAFNNMVPCEIVIQRKNRNLNAAGIFVSDPVDTNICNGYITPKELDELKTEDENNVLLELLNIYFIGDVEISVNDSLTVDDKNYVVKKKIFRRDGNFTKTIVRRLERKNVTT